MKSIVLICVLGFSTFFSCEAQKDDSNFKVYIDNFEQIDLPLSINQDRLETLIEPNSSAIDSMSVDFFIEKNKDMGGGVFLYDLYYYNPLGYFKISEKNTAVIIEKKWRSRWNRKTYLFNNI
jgi:hypothetical protein